MVRGRPTVLGSVQGRPTVLGSVQGSKMASPKELVLVYPMELESVNASVLE
jgi:hypothetical protein